MPARSCWSIETDLTSSLRPLSLEGEMIIGPKHKDKQHRSFDEGADEPPGLIDRESTDIETENPSDDTETVEQVEEEDTEPPIFEE